MPSSSSHLTRTSPPCPCDCASLLLRSRQKVERSKLHRLSHPHLHLLLLLFLNRLSHPKTPQHLPPSEAPSPTPPSQTHCLQAHTPQHRQPGQPSTNSSFALHILIKDLFQRPSSPLSLSLHPLHLQGINCTTVELQHLTAEAIQTKKILNVNKQRLSRSKTRHCLCHVVAYSPTRWNNTVTRTASRLDADFTCAVPIWLPVEVIIAKRNSPDYHENIDSSRQFLLNPTLQLCVLCIGLLTSLGDTTFEGAISPRGPLHLHFQLATPSTVASAQENIIAVGARFD